MMGTLAVKGLIQKQPSKVVIRKRCSEKMQQIYRRTPLDDCFCLNDVDIVAILRKVNSKNLYGWDRFNVKISKYVLQSVGNYLKLICET